MLHVKHVMLYRRILMWPEPTYKKPAPSKQAHLKTNMMSVASCANLSAAKYRVCLHLDSAGKRVVGVLPYHKGLCY